MVLIPLSYSLDYAADTYPPIYNEKVWFKIFSRSIYISMILTSFLPYIFGPALGFILKACKKK